MFLIVMAFFTLIGSTVTAAAIAACMRSSQLSQEDGTTEQQLDSPHSPSSFYC